MASRKRAQHLEVPHATRIFGVETEYGFAALGADDHQLDPAKSVDMLMQEVKKLVPHLSCGHEHDIFTANGSRVYVDYGLHPEVATPECSTPEEAIVFSRAGDRLLARAARAMAQAWRRENVEAVLWKANVDHHTGATWASHESYLHEAPQSRFAEQLMSHLVTRIIYTGAGGFDNRASVLRFVVSPRAFHLEHTISNNSTRDRGIFHTRDEPLAASPNRRLHVLAGESLWSEMADYLRVGTTALLIAQIDAGRQPQAGLDLASPLQALATIAADVSCTSAVQTRPSGHLTAIAIQRRLLESVEADLSAAHLPSWAVSVCKRWRDVLDRLEGSPSSLTGVLDWPTKLAVLKRQCAAEGLEWAFSSQTGAGLGNRVSGHIRCAGRSAVVARLLETDMHFNRLDDRGIFAALDRDGSLDHRIVSSDAIQRALHEPPSTGRARIRAACVERLASNGSAISCTWDRVVDNARGMTLYLGDPFQSEGEEWTPLPPAADPSSSDADTFVEPIARAIAAGTPRVALRHMRLLLSGVELLPLSMCRYLAGVIGSLVPTVPVPILSRGSSTASPVLAALFERVAGHRDYMLEDHVGTLLYRFHEARGRYDLARQVIERLLARAQETGNLNDTAELTNNLGYTHLLEGQCEVAEPLFEQSIDLFENVRRTNEVLNVRANLLQCRFERMDPERWNELVPVIWDVNRALVANSDWRARKTLRLLGRFAEHRGRWRAARGWARKALAASEGVPTQLHEWDHAYLHALESDADAQSA